MRTGLCIGVGHFVSIHAYVPYQAMEAGFTSVSAFGPQTERHLTTPVFGEIPVESKPGTKEHTLATFLRPYAHFMRIRAFLTFLLALACADPSGSYQNIPNSRPTNDWFELQSQANAGAVSLLCSGVIRASLERRAAAEHILTGV